MRNSCPPARTVASRGSSPAAAWRAAGFPFEVVGPHRPVREAAHPVRRAREDVEALAQLAGVGQAVAEHHHAAHARSGRRGGREHERRVELLAVAGAAHLAEFALHPRLQALQRALAGLAHPGRRSRHRGGNHHRRAARIALLHADRAHAHVAVLDVAVDRVGTVLVVGGPDPAAAMGPGRVSVGRLLRVHVGHRRLAVDAPRRRHAPRTEVRGRVAEDEGAAARGARGQGREQQPFSPPPGHRPRRALRRLPPIR